MKKRKFNFPIKPLFLSLIILLVLAFIMGYIWRTLTTSDYFKVSDIIGKEVLNIDLSYLKGKNIFTLDLPGESATIAKVCPDCLRVRLARVLPDRVFLEFVKRKPVALVRLYRYFAVDQEGVFFPSSSGPQDSGLPLIIGLETKLFGIKPGKRCDVKELALALSIIKEVKKARLLKDFQIQKIEVAGVDDITVSMPLVPKSSGYSDWQAIEKQKFLEIKISQGNIVEKVAIMAGLINQEKQNLSNIKYIDLRFKEPVIKFKDAK